MKKILLLCMACVNCVAVYAKVVHYDYALSEVVISKNGEAVLASQPDKMLYADSIVSITWDIGETELNFILTNNTKSSIKLIWDDAVYVSSSGDISKVMHKGIKYIDREEHQQESNIPSGSNLDDLVIPTNQIYWYDGYNGIGTGWKKKPLLNTYTKKKDFEGLRQSNMGAIIKIVCPFVVGVDRYEYTFSFTVKDIQMLD